MSEINVIHVLEMCGMSAKINPDARVNVLGKCRTSRASKFWGINISSMCKKLLVAEYLK